VARWISVPAPGLDPQGWPVAGELPVITEASEAALLFERIVDNIARVVQGNDEAIRLSVTCLVAGGHLLVEDVPGVARRASARPCRPRCPAATGRIQFTSDLLPSDVTGVSVVRRHEDDFRVQAWAHLRNIVLGDEINRTPPKTQSALLESMEERQVTVDGNTYKLPDPFMVIATQTRSSTRGRFRSPSVSSTGSF